MGGEKDKTNRKKIQKRETVINNKNQWILLHCCIMDGLQI